MIDRQSPGSALLGTRSRISYRGRVPGSSSRLGGVLDLVLVWQDRVRQRHALQQLSEHHLRDIGLTRADVEHEVKKPFWRL